MLRAERIRSFFLLIYESTRLTHRCLSVTWRRTSKAMRATLMLQPAIYNAF